MIITFILNFRENVSRICVFQGALNFASKKRWTPKNSNPSHIALDQGWPTHDTHRATWDVDKLERTTLH